MLRVWGSSSRVKKTWEVLREDRLHHPPHDPERDEAVKKKKVFEHFSSQMGENKLFEMQPNWQKATWWCRSTAHGLEVLGSCPTKVCWGSQGGGSAGVVGWWVTVRTDFGPRRLRRFPGCFVKSPFLITESYAYRWKQSSITTSNNRSNTCNQWIWILMEDYQPSSLT